MITYDKQGHMEKYCDWCGKYCGPGGVNSWSHHFCSQRCKRAYDNANGTVDGGYENDSIGHKFHKLFSAIGRFLKILFYIIFGGVLLIEFIMYLIKNNS